MARYRKTRGITQRDFLKGFEKIMEMAGRYTKAAEYNLWKKRARNRSRPTKAHGCSKFKK